MDNKNKPAGDEAPSRGNASDGGPIKDDTWRQVDLRKHEKTPEADLPSDIEPHES